MLFALALLVLLVHRRSASTTTARDCGGLCLGTRQAWGVEISVGIDTERATTESEQIMVRLRGGHMRGKEIALLIDT